MVGGWSSSSRNKFVKSLSKAHEALITQLIGLHGEDGLCPKRADWTEILLRPDDEALNILNLLRFRPQAQTEGGAISGLQAYANYSAAVASTFVRAGGKTLYFGRVDHIFGTVGGTDWHAAILTQYPSPVALASFWLDEEFIAAHKYRANGVEQSRVLVMSALR
jgi:uncharacterized protein (DUF1330 family)